MNALIHSFQSEWLKKKRSLAYWIVFVGAFFTPVIIIIVRLVQHKNLVTLYGMEHFWESLWKNSWESMAIFLLPLGIILTTSLITQIEYRNNGWKQLHSLPLSYSTIFLSKLLLILTMLIQFFILFNIGIYLSALLPFLLVPGVPYPKDPIPYFHFLKENILFFIDCLPILGLQYLLCLKFKNFLVPFGIGFVLWIGALSALPWKYVYTIPYTYIILNYAKGSTEGKAALPAINFHILAIGYFILFILAAYLLYINKKEKG